MSNCDSNTSPIASYWSQPIRPMLQRAPNTVTLSCIHIGARLGSSGALMEGQVESSGGVKLAIGIDCHLGRLVASEVCG